MHLLLRYVVSVSYTVPPPTNCTISWSKNTTSGESYWHFAWDAVLTDEDHLYRLCVSVVNGAFNCSFVDGHFKNIPTIGAIANRVAGTLETAIHPNYTIYSVAINCTYTAAIATTFKPSAPSILVNNFTSMSPISNINISDSKEHTNPTTTDDTIATSDEYISAELTTTPITIAQYGGDDDADDDASNVELWLIIVIVAFASLDDKKKRKKSVSTTYVEKTNGSVNEEVKPSQPAILVRNSVASHGGDSINTDNKNATIAKKSDSNGSENCNSKVNIKNSSDVQKLAQIVEGIKKCDDIPQPENTNANVAIMNTNIDIGESDSDTIDIRYEHDDTTTHDTTAAPSIDPDIKTNSKGGDGKVNVSYINYGNISEGLKLGLFDRRKPSEQIEGARNDLRNDNQNESFDTNNWPNWNSNDMNKYIEYLLKENNNSQEEINDFMNDFWINMKMTGKTLQTFKNNENLWDKFETKMENYSFGAGAVVAHSLRLL